MVPTVICLLTEIFENLFNFLVHYSAVDTSDTLNIHKYFIVKNKKNVQVC